MKVTAIKCSKCNTTVFSRARHDFRRCECGSVFVDGGFDYFRMGWNEGSDFKKVQIDIKQTKKQLYDDWNNKKDKFGMIKEKKDAK